MELNFENKPQIGTGIYTASEIAHILQLPYSKVHTWMVKYWDGKLGKAFETQYSWKTENTRAVSFHTLVEFYIMMQLSEAGVKPKEVLKAHNILANKFNTAFPFAKKSLLEGIKTDGKRIYLTMGEDTVTLDGSYQFNLNLIKAFFKNLDFDSEEVASRFWPLGKEKSVVVDPMRKFGRAVLATHNIYPETLQSHVKAGDSIPYLALVFEISEQEIEDALAYCNLSKAA